MADLKASFSLLPNTPRALFLNLRLPFLRAEYSFSLLLHYSLNEPLGQ